MARVVGVRFRNAGKIYTFDAGEFEISAGGHVVVETARGLEYGTVVGPLSCARRRRRMSRDC